MKEILENEPADTILIPLKLDERPEIRGMNQNQFMDLISKNLIFSQCQAIYFGENHVADAGLKALAENGNKFVQLQEIDLHKNQITDTVLKALVENGHKFPQLQRIYLRNNKITDAGLDALVKNG